MQKNVNKYLDNFSFPAHLIVYYDFKTKEFKIKALGSVYVNEHMISENSDSISIKSFDKLAFNCELCYMPHIYILIFPQSLREEANMNYGLGNMNDMTGMSSRYGDDNLIKTPNKKLPDMSLALKWTNHEKDCLRKYVLIFGYGRWKIIKQNSGGVLSDKPDLELKVFANAFIKTIIEFLPQEKSELRKFLINLIDETAEDPYILPKKDDWGTLLKQRAPAWGKRIQLLYRVCLIVEKFKSERKRNKEIRKTVEEMPESSEAEKLKSELNKTYDYWDNLLNFLPNHAFYGQRPSVWWTKTHDIDLLRGTYKYGYANYQMMRSDQKLSFSKLEKDSSFQEFPNADTITRRLKKLIQIIIKSENNNGVISFEDRKNIKEPTGFNLEEKNKVVKFLINNGVPLNSEGKSDWSALKDQLVTYAGIDSSENPQMIERLVQRLRMISQLVIQLNDNLHNDNEASIDENMLEQMDPDKDGFNMSFEEAEKLNKNMNILHFIRKHIISSKAKLFLNGLNNLTEITKTGYGIPQNLPESWDCAVHDRNLLLAVEENGLSYVEKISKNPNYNFENIEISPEDATARINYLCEFFRDFSTGNKSKKKKDMMTHITGVTGNMIENPIIQKKKVSKINIHKDEEGNIIYPININSSLQILNLGRIEYERQPYHTEKNLFPIGYEAIREHASMFNIGERALYTCEILDGGAKPYYKLTPHEDEKNPIIKESSTGCWIVVCNRINELQGNKRTKVTISGTERFGLCENNVVKLLQSLPGAEKCSRYVMKSFEE